MTKRGTPDQIPGFDKERDPQPAEEALCGDSLGKQEGKDEPSFRVNHCEKPDPRSDLRCLSVLSVLNFSRHTFFFHKSLDQTLAACKSKMKHSQVNADVCKIPKDFCCQQMDVGEFPGSIFQAAASDNRRESVYVSRISTKYFNTSKKG